MLPRIMKRDTEPFEATLALMGRTLGEVPLSTLDTAPGYAALKNAAEAAFRGEDSERVDAAKTLETTLGNVALLIDAAGATELTQRLKLWGFSAADPSLDLLQLNAALKPETTT